MIFQARMRDLWNLDIHIVYIVFENLHIFKEKNLPKGYLIKIKEGESVNEFLQKETLPKRVNTKGQKYGVGGPQEHKMYNLPSLARPRLDRQS